MKRMECLALKCAKWFLSNIYEETEGYNVEVFEERVLFDIREIEEGRADKWQMYYWIYMLCRSRVRTCDAIFANNYSRLAEFYFYRYIHAKGIRILSIE